jgi:hypothetical protein
MFYAITVLAAVVLAGGCGNPTQPVALHLDGWRQLTAEEVKQINPAAVLPPQGMWIHPETGGFFTFSEHSANPTAKDIKAAVAGVADGAMRAGVTPQSVEHATVWNLPAFRLQGTMQRGSASIEATYLYALGHRASYSAVLLQHRGHAKHQIDQLVSVQDSPNLRGDEVTKEVVAIAAPRLEGLRTQSKHGEQPAAQLQSEGAPSD